MAKTKAQQAAIAISMKAAGKKPKTLTKAQKGKSVESSKPTYGNLKGSGWDYFKTPTAKDSSDYKKGFEQGLKQSSLKQFPSPTGPTIRGYNEGFKKSTTKKKK